MKECIVIASSSLPPFCLTTPLLSPFPYAFLTCRDFRESEARDIARNREREVEERREAAAAAAEAAARAEEERRQREAAEAAEEEAELAAAIALSHRLHEESELDAARRRIASHPEPAAGGPEEVSALRFTLPSGVRLQRRFLARDPLQAVRDYVLIASAELGTPLKHFDLGTNFPRRSFPEPPPAAAPPAGVGAGPEHVHPSLAMTLKEAGLFPQAMVFVSQSAAQKDRDREKDGSAASAAAASSSGGAGSA